MLTFHQQLLQAVEATQKALSTIPAESVLLDRVDPVAGDECPALVVELGEARSDGSHGSNGEWDILKLRVEVLIAIHTRGDPHTLRADPVIRQSHQALLADPSLGGLAQRLSFIGSRMRRIGSDATVGIAELSYEATVLVDERTLAIWQHE
jgi:hypothetical protein